MKTEDIKPILETLKQIRKENEFLEEEMKGKYKVGIILKESIDELRILIASFEQLQARGTKINSAKRNNMRSILLIFGDLLDLSLILEVGDNRAVEILKGQLDAKLKRSKELFKSR